VAKRASLPEGKSLFFRKQTDDDATPVAVDGGEAESATVTKSPTRQSAIFLEERHLDWLDERCRQARQRGGRAIRKAVIIRALLDVAMESPVDLTSLRHEDEVVERLRKALRGV